MIELGNEYLTACRECLSEINYYDGNLDIRHSLPICLLDAVYSIGIKYEIVCKNCNNYISYYKLSLGRMADYDDGQFDENEHTISDFLENIYSFATIDECIDKVGFTRNRTSATNGILKLEAVVQIAEIMKSNGINTINDFREFPDRAKLDSEILAVRGQSSGIMLKYLYMLAGDPNKCKPDRWIIRFLQTYFPSITMNEVDEVMERTVEKLKTENPSVTMRMLDSAIWNWVRKQST